jgi:hypothetical protein
MQDLSLFTPAHRLYYYDERELAVLNWGTGHEATEVTHTAKYCLVQDDGQILKFIINDETGKLTFDYTYPAARIEIIEDKLGLSYARLVWKTNHNHVDTERHEKLTELPDELIKDILHI